MCYKVTDDNTNFFSFFFVKDDSEDQLRTAFSKISVTTTVTTEVPTYVLCQIMEFFLSAKYAFLYHLNSINKIISYDRHF